MPSLPLFIGFHLHRTLSFKPSYFSRLAKPDRHTIRSWQTHSKIAIPTWHNSSHAGLSHRDSSNLPVARGTWPGHAFRHRVDANCGCPGRRQDIAASSQCIHITEGDRDARARLDRARTIRHKLDIVPAMTWATCWQHTSRPYLFLTAAPCLDSYAALPENSQSMGTLP